MRFRTELEIPPSPWKLDQTNPIIMMGSCFSTEMGDRLSQLGFDVLQNPFGVIYNPLSLTDHMLRVVEGKSKDTFGFKGGEHWYSWNCHSSFHADSMSQLAHQFATADAEIEKYLERGATLFLTLGTSYVYRHLALDILVANCHREPASAFKREWLSYPRIADEISLLVSSLSKRYPAVRLVLTVSPVKHVRDGLVQNLRSKAQLLLAAAELEKTGIAYFPAYELLTEDLRDYRFYAGDLAHPSEMAVDYIWDQLKMSYLSDSALALGKAYQSLWQEREHRPRLLDSAANLERIEKWDKKRVQLLQRLRSNPLLNHLALRVAQW